VKALGLCGGDGVVDDDVAVSKVGVIEPLRS